MQWEGGRGESYFRDYLRMARDITCIFVIIMIRDDEIGEYSFGNGKWKVVSKTTLCSVNPC